MTQEKVVRVVGYYRDPGFLERIIATFRKLWVNIHWMNARRINEEGLYEVYLGVEENK
ncbi:MAG: ACT domain-containing protein, partial [Sulfolobales archaeon]